MSDNSLAREYRRDMGRYPARRAATRRLRSPPAISRHEVERRCEAFAERAQRERRPELMREFPEAGALGPSEAPWRACGARSSMRNWLAIIAERKTRAGESAPIAAVRVGRIEGRGAWPIWKAPRSMPGPMR